MGSEQSLINLHIGFGRYKNDLWRFRQLFRRYQCLWQMVVLRPGYRLVGPAFTFFSPTLYVGRFLLDARLVVVDRVQNDSKKATLFAPLLSVIH